jgi:hypothetical protein
MKFTSLFFVVSSLVAIATSAEKPSEPGKCKGVDKKTKKCTACFYREWLNEKEGACKPVSDICADWDPKTGGCTDCYFRYSLVKDNCVKVSDFCTIWEAKTGECTLCHIGYKPNKADGGCVKKEK